MNEINELVEAYKLINEFLNYIEKEEQELEKEKINLQGE